jgi:hypothetical protein
MDCKSHLIYKKNKFVHLTLELLYVLEKSTWYQLEKSNLVLTRTYYTKKTRQAMLEFGKLSNLLPVDTDETTLFFSIVN